MKQVLASADDIDILVTGKGTMIVKKTFNVMERTANKVGLVANENKT